MELWVLSLAWTNGAKHRIDWQQQSAANRLILENWIFKSASRPHHATFFITLARVFYSAVSCVNRVWIFKQTDANQGSLSRISLKSLAWLHFDFVAATFFSSRSALFTVIPLLGLRITRTREKLLRPHALPQADEMLNARGGRIVEMFEARTRIELVEAKFMKIDLLIRQLNDSSFRRFLKVLPCSGEENWHSRWLLWWSSNYFHIA